jgi:uncharacterized protein (TIGR03435 family)
MTGRICLGFAAGASILATVLHAQQSSSQQTSAAPRAMFDVVIRPVPASSREPVDFRLQPGGRLTITNLELKTIIKEAYGIKNYQLTRGPEWLATDSFDIRAKVAGDPARKQMLEMLRTALADRFKLKVHWRTEQGVVYALVPAKHGPKLKPSTANQSYLRLQRNTPEEEVGVSYTIDAKRVSMRMLADSLGNELDHPVVDLTALSDEFDFQLTYDISTDSTTGPGLFTAIREQLGLRLRPRKGKIEKLVIDSVERPSAN